MKIENEQRDVDKLYIDKIKECVCVEHIGNIHRLFCKIIQHGEHEYEYFMGSDYIVKDGKTKRLWLLDNAKEAVKAAVNDFNEETNRLKELPLKSITICKDNISVIYEGLSWDTYNYLICKQLPDGNIRESYYDRHTLRDMLLNISWALDHKYQSMHEILMNSTAETISDNPIYIAALENNDVNLQYRLKLYYNIATKEDCLWISNHIGVNILPKLSEEYDKVYVVSRNSMNESDFALLHNSGYQFCHTPYFAMAGSTHSKLELNPHTKRAFDAAKVDIDAISFEEYLKIFEVTKT